MKFTTYQLLSVSLVSAATNSDDSFGNDVAGCKAFADTFANTCDNSMAATTFEDTATE